MGDDAVLTLDLGYERHLSELRFEWGASAARSILALYANTISDDGWSVGGVVHQADDALVALSMSDGGANSAGVRARYLRLYLADAVTTPSPPGPPAVSSGDFFPGGGAPPPGGSSGSNGSKFELRELVAASCVLPEAEVTVMGSQLAYRLASTPTVTEVAPRRGSTAGGTAITLSVAGLPSGLSTADVAVSIVGLDCAVTSVSASEVACTTASYGVTSASSPGVGPV